MLTRGEAWRDHAAYRAEGSRGGEPGGRRCVELRPTRLGAADRALGPAQGTRLASLPSPSRGHRDDPADRAHRRRDDGEPVLRQRPRHGPPPVPPPPQGRRAAGLPRAAAELQSRRSGQEDLLGPRRHAVPVRRRSEPGLEREPHLLRRRPQRRLRPRQRPGGDALLRRLRPALHLLARPALPDRPALFLLAPRPDLPELPLPADGHLERGDPHRQLDLFDAGGQRHDLRPLRPVRGRLEDLLRQPSGAARHPRSGDRYAGTAVRQGRPALPRRRRRGPVAAVQHHQSELRLGLRGEPPGHPVRRAFRRRGDQRRPALAAVAAHGAVRHLRRARRLLRSRPSAAGDQARRHPAVAASRRRRCAASTATASASR